MGGKPTVRSPQSGISYGWLGSGWLGFGWLWPGLPQLWQGGRWSGLAVAAGFALALEGLLLAGWVWDELLGRPALGGLTAATGCFWLVGIIANRRWLAHRATGDKSNSAEDLFPAALTEYLQGNWFTAEQKCRELIRRRNDDVDARLLLATLLRHTDRQTEARTELDALARFDGAAKWTLEIAHERRLLDEAKREHAETHTEETVISAEPAIRRAA